MFLKYAQASVRKIDNTILYLFTVDKVRVALFVTWMWALFGLYTAKAFEAFFKLILKMPDSWLYVAAPTTQRINDTNHVKIVAAHDGTSDVTNKFKLFLKYYWEADELNGGFSFNSLHKLLNCSMLYCSYLMTDKTGTITPEKFWKNVDKFLVEMRDDKCIKYNSESDFDPNYVPFNMVNFDNAQKQPNNNHQDIINLINSVNS